MFMSPFPVGSLSRALVCAAALAWAQVPTLADEIRLKDGKKLYGVIVAYEDNMFKVKTDFGYVLVEKDKIAAIIPSAPAAPPAKPESSVTKSDSSVGKAEPHPAKNPPPSKPETSQSPPLPGPGGKPVAPSAPLSSPSAAITATSTPKDSDKSASAAPPVASSSQTPASPQAGKPLTNTAAQAATTQKNSSSALPAIAKSPTAPVPSTTPAVKNPSGAASSVASSKAPAAGRTTATPPAVPVVTALPPAKAKPAPPPPNREALAGNEYINYTHGFRMYKAPSWKLIEDARKSLPNAIVAMGTSNESTLMVVAEEKSKSNLDATATDVEGRLRDTYGNYRRVSEAKTVAGGYPAVEIHYHGIADDHDWSGTLLVISRGGDMFSVLGMTYSDTDLIQIQENVIAHAIASLEFNSN
jgi:hypothetical protein